MTTRKKTNKEGGEGGLPQTERRAAGASAAQPKAQQHKKRESVCWCLRACDDKTIWAVVDVRCQNAPRVQCHHKIYGGARAKDCVGPSEVEREAATVLQEVRHAEAGLRHKPAPRSTRGGLGRHGSVFGVGHGATRVGLGIGLGRGAGPCFAGLPMLGGGVRPDTRTRSDRKHARPGVGRRVEVKQPESLASRRHLSVCGLSRGRGVDLGGLFRLLELEQVSSRGRQQVIAFGGRWLGRRFIHSRRGPLDGLVQGE